MISSSLETTAMKNETNRVVGNKLISCNCITNYSQKLPFKDIINSALADLNDYCQSFKILRLIIENDVMNRL